jgi:hypothetical protein
MPPVRQALIRPGGHRLPLRRGRQVNIDKPINVKLKFGAVLIVLSLKCPIWSGGELYSLANRDSVINVGVPLITLWTRIYPLSTSRPTRI